MILEKTPIEKYNVGVKEDIDQYNP